jgi:predicted NAD-dependent protein-ADP-ribosyltransferase YbiA (DUF1768 family)
MTKNNIPPIQNRIKSNQGVLSSLERPGLSALLEKNLDFAGILHVNIKGIEDSSFLESLKDRNITRKVTDNSVDFYGYNFLSVVDDNIDTKTLLNQIIEESNVLNKLLHDYSFDNLSEKEKLLYFGSLNQLKNNILVLLNAVFYQEKSKPLSDEMEGVKNYLLPIIESYIKACYELATKNSEDKFVLPNLEIEELKSNIDILRTNTDRSNYIIPECNNHITMVASIKLFAESNEGKSLENISLLALPTGSTELGMLTEIICKENGFILPLYFAPISLHNGSGVINFSSLDKIPEGSEVVLIDDNVSSGGTLAAVRSKLEERDIGVIDYLIPEADIVRAEKRSTDPEIKYFGYAVNRLPVSRNLAPGNDLKKHKQRYLRYLYLLEMAKKTDNLVDKMILKIKTEIVKKPTNKALKRIEESCLVDTFRSTFLSNFYPIDINHFGLRFNCTETAYQYSKFKDLDISLEKEVIEEINKMLITKNEDALIATDISWSELLKTVFLSDTYSPGKIKSISKILQTHLGVSSFFEENKLQIMTELNTQKFQDKRLRKLLINTGDKLLVEGNDWGDTYWGYDFEQKTGLNYMGRILMAIRDKLNEDI